MLSLELAEAEVHDGWGHALVEPEAFEAAEPAPFTAAEPRLTAHLDAAHRAELAALLRREFGTGDRQVSVRAWGLDRYGMWLRCFGLDSDVRKPAALRVEFPAPVRDLHGLRGAYRTLFAVSST